MTKAAKKKSAPKKAAKTTPPEQGNKKMPIMIVLVLAVIVGFFVLIMNAGNLAKSATEKIASDTLGVKVTIASLDISLQDKQVAVAGIKIGNPKGYKHTQAISVDTITIAAESLSKELLTFDEITVKGTTVNLEVQENGTNLTDIRKHAESKKAAKKSASNAQAPKVIIKKLDIANTMLNPSTTLVTNDGDPIQLPPIRITGIGQNSNGVLATQAIAQIVDSIVKVATRASAEQGLLKGMNGESLENIQQDLGLPTGMVDQVKDKVLSIFGN